MILTVLMVFVLTVTACQEAEELTGLENNQGSQEVSEGVSEDVSEVEDSEASEDELKEQDAVEQQESSEPVSDSASEEEKLSDEEDVSVEESEEVSEESEVEEPEFTVEEHSAVLFVKKAVNVRIGPSTDYEKIGGLGKGDQIEVTGIADTGWYQIQYNGATAYVASSYLIDEASYQAMIAEEEAAALAAQQAAEQAAAEQAAQQQAQQEAQQQVQQEAQQQAAAQQQQAAQGDYRAQVVALMNQERANAGLGGVSQNAALDAVAQIRAQEIVQNFSHSRPDGSSCFTVLDQNGIAYMTAGENIAAGYGTPAEVMNGWMNSEGHRANILNGSFGQVGIGYYTDSNSGYGTYWVQVFTN